jgi:membrane associated rhomboid family serine protease
MDLVILPQHWSALLCICIMIGTLVFAYFKKIMMVYALIISNIIIFIITMIFQYEIIGSSEGFPYAGPAGLSFRSVYLLKYSPQMYTIFTSMFIHGGFAHIIGNMLVFFFVGTALEERIGSKKFIIIYLLSGICGALLYSFTDLGSSVPLLGASGAIFGIMGALVFAYPHDEIVMPIPLGFFMILRRIKVVYAVLLFAAIETIVVFLGVQDQTAHFAHLGGLIGGFVLSAILLKGRKTHTKEGKTLYYDSFAPQKNREIDFSKLKKFAITPELGEMLTKIKNENVDQVRDIWLEHFFEKIQCPECSNKINHFDGKIWCEKCGFKDSY